MRKGCTGWSYAWKSGATLLSRFDRELDRLAVVVVAAAAAAAARGRRGTRRERIETETEKTQEGGKLVNSCRASASARVKRRLKPFALEGGGGGGGLWNGMRTGEQLKANKEAQWVGPLNQTKQVLGR